MFVSEYINTFCGKRKEKQLNTSQQKNKKKRNNNLYKNKL